MIVASNPLSWKVIWISKSLILHLLTSRLCFHSHLLMHLGPCYSSSSTPMSPSSHLVQGQRWLCSKTLGGHFLLDRAWQCWSGGMLGWMWVMCHCQVSSMLFLFGILLIICSANCWPSPSNDGTCEVSIEYKLENEHVTLHNVVISIHLLYVPFPSLTFPPNLSHP